ncbi:beta-galactosidase [Edaphobacter dinghuensis]|uniref:Beta-galactosidase n=1 Tax=Edaphobacter dinghuensis TaxID=1560005 RepID=A0A917M8L1_9BACT|nr:beta-galactosidase [Edaphobacter dinghuensis]GGG84248.1 beta-galactosidase [Edaphobacter dinghuensis]
MLVSNDLIFSGASLRLISRILCVLLLCAHLYAQNLSPSPLRLGTAWYPEQWPESRWNIDLTLMEQAHINVARVGEFAWSTMEPSEGHYNFAWLDRAIALAAQHHIAVVIGTPTAAPPAWLTTKYPDTLRIEEDGHRAEHGNREQFSCTSPRYRIFAARIAREMARRYGHNPNVIGWQIDNEIGAPTFDSFAKAQWHLWLAHKYKTIANLNNLWTTTYWSQTYDNFNQIPFHSRNENPALLLDYKHFVTDTWISYVQNQINAIRPFSSSHQFITTNTMHWNNTFDHYALHRNLDIAAWDNYFPDGQLDPVLNAAEHDLVRGYKQRNFWLMETQPSFVNWGPINAPLAQGVVREMAWQAVGHGADAVLYWQWRSALNGQEQYHGTLLGADGLPVPVYREVQQIGSEFALASNALAGTSPHSRVAILQSYDSHWAIDFQRHSKLFDYDEAVLDIYRAASPVAQSIDIISPDADLSSYAVVFAPALNVISNALAQHLLSYVQQGGHLVIGPRSGMKDQFDALNTQRQPGPLAAALGAHVEQYYALDPKDPAPRVSGELGSGTVSVWAEVLTPDTPGARVLLTYGSDATGSNGWLAGHPAAVENTVDKGTLTYIGAMLDRTLTASAVDQILTSAGVHPILPNLASGVELMQRSASGRPPVWILINHTTSSKQIPLPATVQNLLVPQTVATTLELAPHGVAVLTEQR